MAKKKSGARRSGNPAAARFPATISPSTIYTWESQAQQYPETGEPGVSYYAGEVPGGVVDCLVFRDETGALLGILNHYPKDFPPWEVEGNVNVWVHPEHKRQGIATALWEEAVRRWSVRLDHQSFTAEGSKLALALSRRKGRQEKG